MTDGLGLPEARATRKRAACLLWGSPVDVGLVRDKIAYGSVCDYKLMSSTD